MYIAVKPIHFDKWYQVGEEIPDNVIHATQRKRILASGRVACVEADILSSLLPDNTILGEATTEKADDSAVLEEGTIELPVETTEDELEEASPTEVSEEFLKEALEGLPEEPVEEAPKKKTTKKTVKKASE